MSTSDSSPDPSGGMPVWAGFSTATRRPAPVAAAAIAAVTIVLPTPVSVPVDHAPDHGAAVARVMHGQVADDDVAGRARSRRGARPVLMVRRSRDSPSGVDGGRKQPTATPRSRQAAAQATHLVRPGRPHREHAAGRRPDASARRVAGPRRPSAARSASSARDAVAVGRCGSARPRASAPAATAGGRPVS